MGLTTEDGTTLEGSPAEIVAEMRDRSWGGADKSLTEYMEGFVERMGLDTPKGDDDDARAEDFISILAKAGMVERQA